VKFSRDSKKLSKLYYSIAATYEEIGNLEQAMLYYNEDLNVCAELKPIDSTASMLGLASCAEKSHEICSAVVEHFDRAKNFAKQSKKMSIDVLKALVRFCYYNTIYDRGYQIFLGCGPHCKEIWPTRTT